ncbi:MAG: hypothetical protein RL172_175 [Bacteroidota bacterium]
MNGIKNLQQLISQMTPSLQPGVYVFCTVPHWPAIDNNDVLCSFREAEGVTLVLPQSVADAYGLPYQYEAAWITLTVHSSLAAVGLTAAFSGALAKAGISCNVVAAYYHDHIFVDKNDAAAALQVLTQLAAGAA